MGPLGLPEMLFFLGPLLLVFTLAAVVVVGGLAFFLRRLKGRARRFGYESTRAYLRVVPRSDDERRDAVDLTMKGLVLCMLGLVFAPMVLIGLVPLFYGGRKLACASLGLGLVDDGETPRA